MWGALRDVCLILREQEGSTTAWGSTISYFQAQACVNIAARCSELQYPRTENCVLSTGDSNSKCNLTRPRAKEKRQRGRTKIEALGWPKVSEAPGRKSPDCPRPVASSKPSCSVACWFSIAASSFFFLHRKGSYDPSSPVALNVLVVRVSSIILPPSSSSSASS